MSRGWKSGGFPTGVLASIPAGSAVSYDPEKVVSYEIGFKTMFNDRVRLNGAAFFMDYTDKQEQAFINDPSGALLQIFTNAGETEIWGAELELKWLVTDQFNVSAALGYLNAEFSGFETANPGLGDLTGNELPNTQEISFNGRMSYEWPLSNGSNMIASTSFTFQDDVFYTPQNNPIEAQTSYWLVNGRLAWLSYDSNREVSAYVRNITDEEYRTMVFEDVASAFVAMYGNPRTFGISVTYRWE